MSTTDSRPDHDSNTLLGLGSSAGLGADRYATGVRCTVNGLSDLFFDVEARDFIGQPCTVVKRTKAGLIQVALVDQPLKTYSVPQRNVDIEAPNVGAERAPTAGTK